MANVLSGNTYYVDTASTANTNVLQADGVSVVGIIFTSGTVGANFVLSELKIDGTAGDAKLKGSIVTANDTLFIRLADSPVNFNRGIYISTLSSGTLSLIVKIK